MKKLSLTGAAILILCSSLSLAAADRWIHVRVMNQGKDGETVNVNLPLNLAEKVLPSINAGNLKDGKVKIQGKLNGIDVPAILQAVRSAGNNEFVNVKSKDQNVRVAKDGDELVIRVRGSNTEGANVDVRVPMAVADALFSSGKNELNVLAAVRALENTQGSRNLVTVHDHDNNVHIWVDSSNDSD